MTSITRVETTGTAITLSNGEQLREFLMERQGEFAAIAKAGGFQPEALVLELVGMVRKKPEILTCTPDSIMTFIHDVAKIGLVIGRGCFPVPVKDHGVAKLECWIGYKGMKELVKYGGGARDVFAEVVYEGDEFEEVLGLYPDIKHRRGPNAGNSLKLTHVYGVAVISQSIRRHLLLTRAQVEVLRKKNRADTTSYKSPWMTNTEAMWKAKAILAISRDLPQNPRLAHAYGVMARAEGIDIEDLDPTKEVQPTPAPAPVTIAAGATPSAFEEVTDERAIVTLPNWARHPLANKPLPDVGTTDLEALYSTLREDQDKGNQKYSDLIDHIAAELDARRDAVAA